MGKCKSCQPLTAYVWADLLTSSPDWGADAAVSGTPTAFLLPGLPATSPHLGPGLGLGVALWAQSEESQAHKAESITAERHQAHGQGCELGGPACCWGAREEAETGAPSGQAECFGREGGIKKSRAPSSTPERRPQKGRGTAAWHTVGASYFLNDFHVVVIKGR